jgi:hypothetical protein
MRDPVEPPPEGIVPWSMVRSRWDCSLVVHLVQAVLYRGMFPRLVLSVWICGGRYREEEDRRSGKGSKSCSGSVKIWRSVYCTVAGMIRLDIGYVLEKEGGS